MEEKIYELYCHPKFTPDDYKAKCPECDAVIHVWRDGQFREIEVIFCEKCGYRENADYLDEGCLG